MEDVLTALRACAEQTRLRLLALAARGAFCVMEFTEILGQSQPRLSRHLRLLGEAGLLDREREGANVWFSLPGADTVPGALARGVLAQLPPDDPVLAADRRQAARVLAERARVASESFRKKGADWDEMRALDLPAAAVEQALLDLLPAASLGRMLDIGTGTGRMADLFAPHATHVSAFDKSPEMLRIARARLQHLPAGTVDLVQGDFSALPFADARFDTVLFHQVLHYAQAPEQVLAEAARVTRVGGRIAIVDFAAHGREELRETHAHARLGFADEQMQSLLADAGFAAEPPVAVAGETLTVKIWTGRRVAASGAAGPTLSDKKAPQA